MERNSSPPRAGVLCTLAALIFAAPLGAANLLAVTPGTVSLSCNTATGPGTAVSVVVKPATTLTTSTLSVSIVAAGTGLVVTPPPTTVLSSSNQADGLSYSLNLAAGCAGATTGSVALRFGVGTAADASVTVNVAVTATASALTAPAVALTCARSVGPAPVYTPGAAQTVTVTSAAAGGTPFTVDPGSNPTWLSVSPPAGGTANAAGVPLTIAAVAPCGSYAAGTTNTVSIHLRNRPAPDALIPVTLQILGPSPLLASPAAPSLAYTKGSETPASVGVTLSASGSQSVAFSVDPASLPAWLTADALSGTAPRTLHFSTTAAADTLATGVFTASIHVKASGFSDFVLPLALGVSNPAPKLTVAEGTSRDITWPAGQPVPTAYVTVASTGAAIPYTIATGGAAAPVISSSLVKGFAYSTGTPIPVTFDSAVLAAAAPGSVVNGTVTFTWGVPASTLTVTFHIAVQQPAATVTAISPSNLPTAAPGQKFTVVLTGTGFVAGSDPAQQTFVGIVAGGSMVADANLTASVPNPSNIIVTIRVPAADTYLPFSTSGTGGTVVLGVCNPLGAACSVPTGTAQLTIGVNPVVQAVTSASSYVQAVPPALPVVAPYDVISLFGTSFCTAGGTGCTPGQVLYGIVDPASERFPVSLSPDPAGPAQRQLSVTFQTHAATPALIAKAPLLFATNEQINLVVPAAVASYVGKSIDMVVNFGYGEAATTLSSSPIPLNVVAADPGVFTVGGDGQGDGAILAQDDSVVAPGNEAAMRSNPADSDIVQIFMTGLGVPDSSADNSVAGTGLWPADCVAVPSYLAALNTASSGSAVSLDGALVAGALFGAGRLPPCMRTAATIPSVTIGGQPATVTYAGWVADAVAGQYQVNVRLPGSKAGPFTSAAGATLASLTAPVELPVTVTARGRSSQPGVMIAVAPRLKLTAPAAIAGKAGTAWAKTGTAVTASEGTVPYRYAVTVGSLPAGLTLDPASGAIAGTPAAGSAGSYPVTVGATDAANLPLTGSVTFTVTVADTH